MAGNESCRSTMRMIDRLDPAAGIGGRNAERTADDQRDEAGHQAHLQRDAQAVENGGEQVAAVARRCRAQWT